MKLAHWTPSPVLEREAEEESAALQRAFWRVRVVGLLGIGLLPFACFAVPASLFIVVVPVGVLLFAWLGLRSLKRLDEANDRVQRWIETSREEFGERTGWPVDLIVHQGAAPTGADRGMLWIEDGRLYFSGRRTSFGLTADQAVDFCRFEAPIPHLRNDLQLRLRAKTAGGAVSLSFQPVSETGQGRATELDLRIAVNHWIGRGTETGGQLPPLEPGPDAPTESQLFSGAVDACGFWVMAIGGIAGLIWLGLPQLAVLYGFFGLIVGSFWTKVWSPRVRVRAWRDRRQLTRRSS